VNVEFNKFQQSVLKDSAQIADFNLVSYTLGQLPLDQIRVEKVPRQAGWMLYLAIPLHCGILQHMRVTL